MAKTYKARKSPNESATKFNVGTKKKGNDGNMWKIVKNKNGIKRWLKISKQTLKSEKKTYDIWGKNINLEKFWRKLAKGESVILIYTNNKTIEFTMPKTNSAKSNKYKELENDNNIKAIITSAQSVDSYESLYKRVKNKTPDEIIKNYKKYLINYHHNDKTWYL